MKWPEHVLPDANRTATAPYNFVPLPEAVYLPKEAPFAAHDRLDPKLHHGWIDLVVTTETELYTRCAYAPEHEGGTPKTDDRRADFFHNGNPNEPVIPGASVRGMTRALVEILSFSRLTRFSGRAGREGKAVRVKDERLVYRAVADTLTPAGNAYRQSFGQGVTAGYLCALQGGAWGIRPARDPVDGQPFHKVKIALLRARGFEVAEGDERWKEVAGAKPSSEDQPVLVQPLFYKLSKGKIAEVGRTGGPGFNPGSLVLSGWIEGRKNYVVVAKIGELAPIPVDDPVWRRFLDDQAEHRGIPTRQVKVDGGPIFFLLDGVHVTAIGPTPFFRIPYGERTTRFLPWGVAADERNDLDLAERIFGTVNGAADPSESESPTGAWRGRVRFDDLVRVPSPESPFESDNGGYRVPAILSSPKPTSFQLYLTQPGDRKEDLLSYSTDARQETVLRGFKRYWHRGSPSKSNPQQLFIERPEDQAESQSTRIRPVRPKVRFTGRVRFENLVTAELGALLTALELPGACRHQLGMGKPLGMGTIHVKCTLALVSPRVRYSGLGTPGAVDRDACERLRLDAMEDFRAAMMAHYNGSVLPAVRVAPGGSLWTIPRLAELRAMLEPRPARERAQTAYQTLEQYRERLVLPSPRKARHRTDAPLYSGGGSEVPDGDGPPADAAAPPPVASQTAAPSRVPSAASTGTSAAATVLQQARVTAAAATPGPTVLDGIMCLFMGNQGAVVRVGTTEYTIARAAVSSRLQNPRLMDVRVRLHFLNGRPHRLEPA